MSDADDRQYLIANGWEQVLTAEDGCETWTVPHEQRKHWHPDVFHRHGRQYFWDLDQAVEFQRTSLSPAVQAQARDREQAEQ